MSNTYQIEKLADVLEEMKPILQKHWEEVALYKDQIALNPDYDKYQSLEEMGALRIATVRSGGKLIGYFISMINPHLHYQDHLYAINDILYLEESFRGADVALELFLFAEEDLKSLGVDVLIIAMKTAKPFDALCEALGHSNVERVYSKFIGEKK
tara:strand:- start:1682 stop:2146 length:465 start_codon:yes stop_codon:yes gene_type:complete